MTNGTPKVAQGACRWMTAYEHALLTASKRELGKAQVTCCHCKAKVDYMQSWVSVPFGAHSNRLPLPVFLFCQPCSLLLDPQVAYMSAYQKDKAASLPDPVKVEREQELNEYLSQPIIDCDHRFDNGRCLKCGVLATE